MTLPKRWIEDKGESTPLERAILRPALEIAIPAGAEQRIWTKLMAAAPLTAVALTASSAAGSSAATAAAEGGAGAATAIGAGVKLGLGVVGKAFAIGVASGVLFAGGVSVVASPPSSPEAAPPAATQSGPASAAQARQSSSKSPSASIPREEDPAEFERPAPPRSPARETPPAPREARPLEGAQPAAPSVTSFPSFSPAPAPSSRLREEAAVLRRAREALRQGNLSGASAELDAARTAFPRGALGEEREALTIELMARSGQRDAARQRAGAFLQSFPNSPYAGNVRRAVGNAR
jgi:hypothetical protein